MQLIEHATATALTHNFKHRWATGFWYQLRVLLERQGKQSRGEAFSAVNIFQILAVAIIASAVWWQSNNIRDTTGVFFFISIQQSFNALAKSCFGRRLLYTMHVFAVVTGSSCSGRQAATTSSEL
eukprot:17935-Heterococcus_DN1.PRE.4